MKGPPSALQSLVELLSDGDFAQPEKAQSTKMLWTLSNVRSCSCNGFDKKFHALVCCRAGVRVLPCRCLRSRLPGHQRE